MDMRECPICKKVSHCKIANGDSFYFQCSRCGNFLILLTYYHELSERESTEHQRLVASTWTRYNITKWEPENYIPTINEDNMGLAFSAKAPNFFARADILLTEIEKNTAKIGQYVHIDLNSDQFISRCWCADRLELSEIIQYLESTHIISREPTVRRNNHYKIDPSGWKHLELISHSNMDSLQGFVAMSFAEEINPIYSSVIAPAVTQAGYSPHRVDQKEHVGKIDDEIILQIRRSRFIVADFTGQRGGVYYEAGFAHGLNLPTFFTCRANEVKELHFDIRQYNCILWEESKLDIFRTALARRIEAVLGRGPVT